MEEARARADEREQELEQLDALRDEADGRLAIALREAAAFEDRLAQEEVRVEQVRVQAALADLEQAVSARNEADEALAAKIFEVLEGLAQHEDLTRVVTELHAELAAHGTSTDRPGAAPELSDAWQRLQQIVRTSLGEELDDELIEAAVASPLGQAIDELPTHLQEAARRRWRESTRSRRGRDRASG